MILDKVLLNKMKVYSLYLFLDLVFLIILIHVYNISMTHLIFYYFFN